MSKNRKGKTAAASDKLIIKSDVIAKYLSEFTYSEDYQGMQFVRLDLPSMKIDNLDKSLLEVNHLRYMDLSDNNIQDLSNLQTFASLIHLNLNKNKIKSWSIFTGEETFPKLKKLELAENGFTDIVPLTPPKLEYLDLSNCKIDKHDSWVGNSSIKVLKLVNNKIKSLSIIKDMSALEEVYLAENPISSFKDYENVPALKILHLRSTKIDKIEEEIPELPMIEVLNLRETKINTLDNLKNIFQFTTLKNLNILDTPLEKNASSFNLLLAEILNLYHGLAKFSKTEMTEQHKYEALYLSEYRWKKSEEERLRKEEEERLKAEAEGADD